MFPGVQTFGHIYRNKVIRIFKGVNLLLVSTVCSEMGIFWLDCSYLKLNGNWLLSALQGRHISHYKNDQGRTILKTGLKTFVIFITAKPVFGMVSKIHLYQCCHAINND